MKRFLVITSLIFLSTSFGLAQDSKPIKVFSLTDGTTVKGVLAGVRENDGAFIIETSAMGTIAINPDNVVTMANENSLGQKNQQQPQINPDELQAKIPGGMKQAQEMLMKDPAIQQSIQELMSDPEIMQLLQDPQLMQSILSMDPATIQSNPKIQKLLKHPKMMEIIQKAGPAIMQGSGQ